MSGMVCDGKCAEAESVLEYGWVQLPCGKMSARMFE